MGWRNRRATRQAASDQIGVDDRFRQGYPDTTNADLARRYGVSETTVARWARKLGLRKSREHIRAIRSVKRPGALVRRGAAHWKWNGGHPWERFATPEYAAWRRAVLERDGYRCRACGRQCRKHERGLAAHHVLAWSTHPASRFDVDNGLTLCRDCHMRLHGLGPRPVAMIDCACGCGTLIAERDPCGRPRRFVNHHAKRGTRMSAKSRTAMSRARRGRRLTDEHRRKISAGLRSSAKRIGRPPHPTSEGAPPAA